MGVCRIVLMRLTFCIILINSVFCELRLIADYRVQSVPKPRVVGSSPAGRTKNQTYGHVTYGHSIHRKISRAHSVPKLCSSCAQIFLPLFEIIEN